MSNLPPNRQWAIGNRQSSAPSSLRRSVAPSLSSSAFTLVELLIAISIIAILAGLLLYGMRHMGDTTKRRSTQTTLANLQGMLAEFEQRTGFQAAKGGIPAAWNWVTPPALPVAAGENFWLVVHLTGTTSDPIPAPASVTEGSADRTGHAAILNTQIAIGKLISIPANKSAIMRLPDSQLLKFGGANDPPVLLDAWNNPILMVPGAGLGAVTIDGAARTITSPNARPFFASAGPDGNFATGDDNLYSFEN